MSISGFQFDYHNGVTTQSDGKILIAGYVGASGVGTGTDIAVIRVNSTGAIDFSYGSGGVAVLATAGDQQGKSITTDPNTGRAIVAGTTRAGGIFNVAVARFTPAGVADSSFDGDGLATASFSPGQNALAYCVVAQPNGRIITGGKTFNGSTYDFALARFTTAGILDSTFDGDGLRTHSAIPTTSDEITGLALQSDGKIVAVGTSTGPSATPSQFILARYTDTGANDAGFGAGGVVIADFGAGNVAGAIGVALQADGKIVAAGGVTNFVSGDTHFALARYTAGGLVDNSFDGDGKVTVTFGNSDRGEAVAMQNFGGSQRIVVAGSSGSQGSFAIARLNLDGSLDTTFDGDGKVLTPVTFPGSSGVERVPGLAIENFTSPLISNIITVGVDTSNRLILSSHSGGDTVFVDDEWTIQTDVAPAGLSNGDSVKDLTTGITATFGVDAFSTIPNAIAAVSTGGRIYVLGGSDKTFKSGVFTLSNSKTIDLTDNALIVLGGAAGTWGGLSYSGLTGQIAAGRLGGTWNGIGIVTSTPSAQGQAALHTLAIATGSQVKSIAAPATAVWRGQTVTGSDVLVMFTYGGDANLDGKINVDDYTRIDSNVGIGGKGYYNGDFNYDGTINVDDYTIIDSNVGIQGPPFASGSIFSTTMIESRAATPASNTPSTLKTNAVKNLLDDAVDDAVESLV
ncbi:MAG: hypothetical protein ABI039_12350 [Vicinamibacterales bacterium]